MLCSRKLFVSIAVAVVLLAEEASAVPMGSGSLVMDLQGTATDNVTCLYASYDNATYDDRAG